MGLTVGCFPAGGFESSRDFYSGAILEGNFRIDRAGWIAAPHRGALQSAGLRPAASSKAAARDDSLSEGVKTGNVVEVELPHEMLTLFVQRFEAHARFGGALFVGLAFGGQLKRLHLA